MTSVNDNSSGMFATPDLTSSSNGENYIILYFQNTLQNTTFFSPLNGAVVGKIMLYSKGVFFETLQTF